MNELLNTIFGLDGLGFGSEGARFSFAWELPAYAWALLLLGAAGLAWWCYWRIAGPVRARVGLGVVRGLLLALVLVLAAGPQLTRTNERVEKDWIAVLVDRSASLGVADAPGGQTRDDQLRAALAASGEAWDELAADRNVLWLGFDAGVYDIDPQSLAEAAGPSTRLDVALDRVLARLAAEPISSIVLLSDGRSVSEPSRGVVRALRAQRVPVLALPLGSAEPVGDWTFERADAPAAAFLDDVVPVRVRLERRGSAGSARVELVDRATGLVLDTQPAPEPEVGTTTTELTLTHRAADAGDSDWIVRVVPDGRDLIPSNNERSMSIELIDRPLRIAYFDGYPRWEQRNVKNLLLREASIESASLLLATDRAYLQEGAITISALPRSPEEWADFDVVVIGDVAPDVFSQQQLESLRDHIAVRGAGLLWIAGSGATPGAWAGTPLADLLPFTNAAGVGPILSEVVMVREPASERLGLLALDDSAAGGWPDRLTDPASGFSLLRYAQQIDADTVKPASDVLAAFARGDGSATPAVLSMRFGAGKVVYVATDETWRWRYALGEVLQERFWLPLLRHLGRASATRAGRACELTVSPREATPGRPVRVALELLDQALIDSAPSRVSVRVRSGGRDAGTLELAPEPGEGSVFAATWTAPEAGRYDLEATGLGIAPGVSLRVRPDDDELRTPDADHAMLAALAEQTGGRILTVADLSRLPEIAPNRERRTEAPPDVATLWDTLAALIAVLLLVAVEWVGRRLIKLL